MKPETIFLTEGIKITKEGVLKGVHFLGLVSKNGYTYATEAVKSAASLYNDIDIYINHSKEDDKGDRDVKDKFGFTSNATFVENVGIVGDLHLNTGHPYYEAISWWAENNPSRIGMSHEALVKYDKASNSVTEIAKPKSVDIVCNPATTKGLFAKMKEGVIEDEINSHKVSLIWMACQDLYYEAVYPMGNSELTEAEKAAKIVPVLQDAIAELQKISPSTQSKESVMEWKDIVLDELKKQRPDLAQAIAKEAVDAEKALDTKVSEAIKDLPEKAKTQVFVALVRDSIKAGVDIKPLIDDRKEVVKPVIESVVPAGTKQHEESAPKKLDEATILAKFQLQ